MTTATALAHPTIAFIKYWGNIDHTLRVPTNGSFSMNLDGLETRTMVTFDSALSDDQLNLNGKDEIGAGLTRVSTMLQRVRDMSDLNAFARVVSTNNFPTGTGIASSASSMAALALAASAAAGIKLTEPELSRLARTGSGSASRSIPGGFVEWAEGGNHIDSYAFTLAPANHWDLVDIVAVVSDVHKSTGSTSGHALADTSPLQAARVADAPRRVDICRAAILNRDFDTFADIVELDNNMMHSVMMTSNPRLVYWLPPTLSIIHAVEQWRAEGIPVCYTIDAGPNVHVLCLSSAADEVKSRLERFPGILDLRVATPGGPARLVSERDNP